MAATVLAVAALTLWDNVGVLVDHIGAAPVRTLANGLPVVIDVAARNIARPILCGEIVEDSIEGDVFTTRCAARITHLDEDGPGWACDHGHGRDSGWTLEGDLHDAYLEEMNERNGGW